MPPSAPATPAPPTTPGTFVSAPSTPTGTWRHPAFETIAKRKAESEFNDASFRRLAANGGALLASFILQWFVNSSPTAKPYIPLIPLWGIYALQGLRILFVYNLWDPVSRLLRPADEFADIPLTPDQRRLLGLNPSTPLSSPADATFITPPRYKKTPTQTPNGLIIGGDDGDNGFGSGSGGSLRNSFGASGGNGGGPARTASPTPLRRANSNTTPSFSTSTTSTLSYDSPSPMRRYGLDRRGASSPKLGMGINSPSPKLGMSGLGSSSGSLGAPSMPVQQRAPSSVTPNSRWVYEKALQRGKSSSRMPSFL